MAEAAFHVSENPNDLARSFENSRARGGSRPRRLSRFALELSARRTPEEESSVKLAPRCRNFHTIDGLLVLPQRLPDFFVGFNGVATLDRHPKSRMKLVKRRSSYGCLIDLQTRAY